MSLRPESGVKVREEFKEEIKRKEIVRGARKSALKRRIKIMLEMGANLEDIIVALKNEYGYRNVIRAMVEMGLFSGGEPSGGSDGE